MFFIGTSSVYILVAISLQRYYIIKNGKEHKVKPIIAFVLLFVCLALGLTWAVMPLSGWSNYSLQGALTTCGPDIISKNANVFSFNASMYAVVFVLPFMMIIISNIKIYQKVILSLFSHISINFNLNFKLLNS